jgi:signal transduction histidine kinase/ActR/RegA family two-component response regulator/HAMP domain-containing protein
MTDTLRTFAEQVTTVAREVGIEGKLGGQAKVPGAAGTWRDLTDNVNQLAGNLTTQVRAISEVASAVTKGNLTRTIDVEAQGEVLSLKDTINQMIANLKDTTLTNKEQDWLKTNLAKFSQMMQGQRSLEELAQLIMSELTPLVTAQHGTFFVTEAERGPKEKVALRLLSSYALKRRKGLANRFELGEGLVGQCALEKKTILVNDVPDDYVQIGSSVGDAPPRNILVLPVLFEGQIKGVIELASFQHFSPIHITFLEQLAPSIGVVFNMITASMRTEELLEELKGSNVELEKRTNELEEKATLLEDKNREIARASASLEEKARQLALVSKYKSEFLANMSHELRTPLNSLLILAKLLADNEETNLSDKQVEYARTIHAAGNDLLSLINQILDLSKIEAGKLQIETKRIAVSDLRDYVQSTFRQVAEQKGLGFDVRIGAGVPANINTDAQRLQQILKNLLSNAFKFTERGRVELKIGVAEGTGVPRSEGMQSAGPIISFAVCDTGIGIPSEKQQLIFEAFQQADASTSRMYGGTGLGLTISRELARLLGGEIAVESNVGVGSTFTLYLPLAAEQQDGVIEGEVVSAPLIQPEPEVPAQSAVELKGKKVLLVDDDPRNLFAVTSLLERRDINVVCASTAQEGISLLSETPDIDLILMDIMLPGIDGYEATRQIRAKPEHTRMPIIALTAKAMPGDREKCLEAGCTAFVAKPVDVNRLILTMKEALGVGAQS